MFCALASHPSPIIHNITCCALASHSSPIMHNNIIMCCVLAFHPIPIIHNIIMCYALDTYYYYVLCIMYICYYDCDCLWYMYVCYAMIGLNLIPSKLFVIVGQCYVYPSMGINPIFHRCGANEDFMIYLSQMYSGGDN